MKIRVETRFFSRMLLLCAAFFFVLFVDAASAATSNTVVTSPVKTLTNSGFASMVWTGSTAALQPNTTLALAAKSCTAADCSDKTSWATCTVTADSVVGNTYTINDASGKGCIVDGQGFVQWQVTFSMTEAATASPFLDDVTISNDGSYFTSFINLISSAFNTGKLNNSVQKISWSATNDIAASQGEVKFQIRTAPDNGGAPDFTNSVWCGPGNGIVNSDNSCSTTKNSTTAFGQTYYTDKSGVAAAVNSLQATSTGNQWIQYASFIRSTNGTLTPTLSNVTLQYAYNTPPIISVSAPTQIQTAGADVGKVQVDYQINETKGDVGAVEQTSAFVNLFYRPNGVAITNAGTLNNGGDTNASATIIVNKNGQQIPSAGKVLIDNELVDFSTASVVGENVTLSVTSRHQDFSTGFPTLGAAHTTSSPIYFLATNVAGANMSVAGISEVASSKNIIWNAKNEPNVSLTGNVLSNVSLKVAGNDGDAYTPVGSGVSALTALDYLSPMISSITTDPAHSATGSNKLYYNKDSAQIPLTVNFSENINFDATGGKTIVLHLNSGICTISSSIVDSSSATCQYAIGTNEFTPAGQYLNLATPFVSTDGVIADKFANALSNFTPIANLNAATNIVIDNTNPTADDLAPAEKISKTQFTQTVANVSDGTGSGIATYLWTKTSGSGTLTFGSVNAASTTISASVDGIYGIKVKITDNSGNFVEKTMSLIWDQTNPTQAGKPNVPTLTKNAKPTISWAQSSDATSGLFSYELQRKLDAGSWVSVATLTDNATLIATNPSYIETSNLPDGNYAYQIITTDKAGNSSTSATSDVMVVDTIAPVLGEFQTTSPASADPDVNIYTIINNQINIRAKFSEPVKAGSNIWVILDNTTVSPTYVNLDQKVAGQEDMLEGTYTVLGPKLGHDADPLNIKSIAFDSLHQENVQDLAGNVQNNSNSRIATINSTSKNLGNFRRLVVFTTPPTLENFTATTGAFKKGQDITITAKYKANVAIVGNSISVRLNSGRTIQLDVLSGDTISKTFTLDDGDVSTQKLQVAEIAAQHVVDKIGNVLSDVDTFSAYNVSHPTDQVQNIQNNSVYTQIDFEAPTLGGAPIAIQNTAGKTSLALPNITLGASDNFDLAKVVFSLNDGVSWCAPIDYAAVINSFDITTNVCGGNTNNEIKTVTVKFRDRAGNESIAASATVGYDNSKPQLQTLTTDTVSGTYGADTAIKITATYDENISAGNLVVNLNNGKQITLDEIENGNSLKGSYVVGATGSLEDIDKLRVAAIVSQSVSDTADPVNVQNGTSLAGISANIDDGNKSIQIDTTAPTAEAPSGKFVLDRFSENNKVKVTIKPYDDDLSLLGMSAEIRLFETDAACNDPSATVKNESISGETTFTYDDSSSSVKKACLKLTDKQGNVSAEIVALTPGTPTNFAYTDLTGGTFMGAILKWDQSISDGTGGFKQYNVLRCSGVDCTPTQNQVVTNKSQNYFVYNNLVSGTTYCYALANQDNNDDVSKISPEKICYAPGEGPISANTKTAFESEPYVANISKNSANVVFKTVDANNGNSALATTAKIKVYDDEALTNLVKTVDDELAVTHAVAITGLTENKKYYLEISATDTSILSNLNRTVVVKFDKVVDLEKYSFATAGVLSVIDNIKESVITSDKAIITFSTDQEAKCFVDYKDALITNYNALSHNPESGFFVNHSITLTELFPITNYDYKITCNDESMTVVSSAERHFKTPEKGLTQADVDAASGQSDKIAPEITSVALANVTGESATVIWNTNEKANSLVTFEVEGATYSMMVGDDAINSDKNNFATSHTVMINGLIPATKYLFNVVSYDLAGNIGISSQSTLTTKQPSELSSIKVVSTSLGQATVTWITSASTTSTVEYGLTTAYGQSKQDNANTKEHSIILADLTPGETYHFRVMGEDSNKNIFSSSDITFQPKAPPKISDFKIDAITEHGAVVTFTTNVPTDALITYSNVDNADDSGVQGNPVIANNHSVTLKNLNSGVTFSVKVKVKDVDGNDSEETFSNFTTTKDEQPPKIDRVKTDTALTQNDKVQAIISWITDEMATGKIVYKEGKSGEEKTFNVNDQPSFSHVGVITSFKPGVVYYFKVKSTDIAENAGTSTDFAVLTPKKRQNIIQIIIGNFTEIFGWAKF